MTNQNGHQSIRLAECQQEVEEGQARLRKVQQNLLDLIDRQQTLAARLDALAEEARQKAVAGQEGMGYWRGVAFGLETAAVEVRRITGETSTE